MSYVTYIIIDILLNDLIFFHKVAPYVMSYLYIIILLSIFC